MPNPLSHLYKICNTGDPAEKHKNLADFPIIIDVEPVGLCNFKCLCCPTGLNALQRPQGFMEWGIWKKIVDECAPHGTALRPYGWGEPLLHPDIVEMIRYASQAGLMTHMNTNASKLTPVMAELLVVVGLTSIKFSFQGVDRATYAEMRQRDYFEEMLEKIEVMRRARGNGKYPYIAASTSITDETPEMVAAFKERVEPLVDELTIGKTIFGFIDLNAVRVKPEQRAMLERFVQNESTDRRHPVPCPEVWDKMSIRWDGKAVVCCNSYANEGVYGNVADNTIAELWRHPAVGEYRERLARKDYDAPLCRDCWDYAGLTEGA